MNNSHPSSLVFRYFIVIFLCSGLLLVRLLWPFLAILILSFLLTGVFQPVYSLLNRRLSASVSSLTTCLLIVLVVFVPLSFFIAALSKEAVDLYQLGKWTDIGLKLKVFLQENAFWLRVQEFLGDFGFEMHPEQVSMEVANFSKEVGRFMFNQASAWAANLMTFVFDFFMMIVVIFFMLIDHERLVNYILRLSPLPDEQERQLIEKFKDIAGAVVVGNGVCGLIQGVLGGLAFVFLGFAY